MLSHKGKAAHVSMSRLGLNPVAADRKSAGDKEKVDAMSENIHHTPGAINPPLEKSANGAVSRGAV